MKTILSVSLALVSLLAFSDDSLPVRIMAPDGSNVCTVSLPSLCEGASVETTNLPHGVAWRIRYDGAGERTLENEEWMFDFGEDLRCWPVSHAQGEYVPKTLSTMGEIRQMPDLSRAAIAKEKRGQNYETIIPGSAESPLVVEGAKWTAVMGDAGVLDYARIRFVSGPRKGTVKTVLEGSATVKLPYATPWRYIHVEASPSALAQSQPGFVKCLCAPSKVADTSWIKPGKVLRVAKLTTETAKSCVDFAVRNGFPYIELDSGWYGDERRGDPLKPGLAPEKIANGEQLDLAEILAYAKGKGIGVILYVNREPLKKNAKAIFDKLVEWGVVGVKLGFVNVGHQKWREKTVEWIEMCAERRLLVDIHDEFRTAGIENTYPNVLTVEGIRGNEEMPVASHNAALVYTRYLDGPGDYTPCWKVGRVKNSLAHQLAMPCVYTSGFQFLFWYQRPDQIDEKNPALDFWREIPTAFDETRFVDGKIGEFAIVARRVGKKWFVGCLNANERRDFSVPLDFIHFDNSTQTPKQSNDQTTLSIRLFRDADPANDKPLAPLAIEGLSLSAKDRINVSASPNGGWAAIIEEKL